MNAEIYFPREGTSFAQTTEDEFDNTIKKLNSIGFNVMYKTEINMNKASVEEAFKVTDSGSDNISFVVISDAVEEDDADKAAELLKNIGITEKAKRISFSSAKYDTVENAENNKTGDKTAEKEKKRIDKLRKKQEKALKKMKSDGAVTDISESYKPEDKKLYAYTVEYNGKLVLLLPKTENVDTDFNTLLYSSVKKVISPKKKQAFWKRFIPCAGDRPIDVVRKIVFILAVCTFIVSAYMLLDILVVQPTVNEQKNAEIKDLLVDTSGSENSKSSDSESSGGVLADFENLLAINPDTVGWITVANTVIDYVVVQPSDDKDVEYYLYRDFYGNSSKYGTIFMDYRSSLDSKNIILHGHHMQDGQMFANLTYYTDLEFYQSTPTITFNSIYSKDEWKVIAVFKTNTLEEQGEFFNYLRGDFASDYDFLNFVYQLRVRSIIDCPVDVNEDDTLLTLSTCAYDFDEFRLVIVARKVRDGEDSSVDVSEASYNSNPLYPDIWYTKYGGTAPTVTTFQEAYNNGEIDWYDGTKTDWSSEDEELLARELQERKDEVIELLNEYVEEKSYEEDEQEQIDSILESYTDVINTAENISDVNEAYDDAITSIDKIKTSEQIASETSEEQESSRLAAELSSAKSAAIAEMQNSIAGNTYRTTQLNQVNELISTYTQLINSATDKSDVETLKKEAISELSKVKTDSELKAEESSEASKQSSSQSSSSQNSSQSSSQSSSSQNSSQNSSQSSSSQSSSSQNEKLTDAKSSAISELENYLSLSNYYEDEQNEISSIISKYKSKINSATSVSAVESYLASAKSELDNVKTSAEIDAETPTVSESSESIEESTVSEEESVEENN